MELTTKGGFERLTRSQLLSVKIPTYKKQATLLGNAFLPISCIKQVISESLLPLFQNESNYENDFRVHKIEPVVEQIFI